MGGFGGLGTVGVGVMQRWSANDGGAPLHHCATLTIQSPHCAAPVALRSGPTCRLLWCRTLILLGLAVVVAAAISADEAPACSNSDGISHPDDSRSDATGGHWQFLTA